MRIENKIANYLDNPKNRKRFLRKFKGFDSFLNDILFSLKMKEYYLAEAERRIIKSIDNKSMIDSVVMMQIFFHYIIDDGKMSDLYLEDNGNVAIFNEEEES